MVQILVVEDSKLFGSLVKKKIESELDFKVRWVRSYSEAVRLINETDADFFAALLDLNLPDAPGGEIVDYVLSRGIPTIVFTGVLKADVRDVIWSKKVVDYVVKESSQSIEYVVSLIRRIHMNGSVKVLVVDDSQTFRRYLCDLLRVHKYTVLEAPNGAQALKVLEKNRDISLVITDYTMPNMDGFELTEQIRSKRAKSDLAVIGISAQGDNIMSARFIKNGANDFINKPFLIEEFYCRVTQNVEMIEQVRAIESASNIDYLTELYNRRYFFESGRNLFASAKRGHVSIVMAMIDIDFFKVVNDTYSHDAGDTVLKQIAAILGGRMRQSDIVARYGGEEFSIIATNMEPDNAANIFDGLRKTIEETEIQWNGNSIQVTVSMGVCTKLKDSPEEMARSAESMLYQAKQNGRNKVVISD